MTVTRKETKGTAIGGGRGPTTRSHRAPDGAPDAARCGLARPRLAGLTANAAMVATAAGEDLLPSCARRGVWGTRSSIGTGVISGTETELISSAFAANESGSFLGFVSVTCAQNSFRRRMGKQSTRRARSYRPMEPPRGAQDSVETGIVNDSSMPTNGISWVKF